MRCAHFLLRLRFAWKRDRNKFTNCHTNTHTHHIAPHSHSSYHTPLIHHTHTRTETPSHHSPTLKQPPQPQQQPPHLPQQYSRAVSPSSTLVAPIKVMHRTHIHIHSFTAQAHKPFQQIHATLNTLHTPHTTHACTCTLTHLRTYFLLSYFIVSSIAERATLEVPVSRAPSATPAVTTPETESILSLLVKMLRNTQLKSQWEKINHVLDLFSEQSTVCRQSIRQLMARERALVGTPGENFRTLFFRVPGILFHLPLMLSLTLNFPAHSVFRYILYSLTLSYFFLCVVCVVVCVCVCGVCGDRCGQRWWLGRTGEKAPTEGETGWNYA